MGSHAIKNWSSTQAVIALSSGEAEYYAIVKGSAVGLGAQSILKNLGVQTKVVVKTDSKAAKGIATRMGLSKARHIESNLLWLQYIVRKGTFL